MSHCLLNKRKISLLSLVSASLICFKKNSKKKKKEIQKKSRAKNIPELAVIVTEMPGRTQNF